MTMELPEELAQAIATQIIRQDNHPECRPAVERAEDILRSLSLQGYRIVKGESEGAQPNLTLDIVIYSENGFLIGQGLQKDIGAQADTLDKLLVRLRCTVAAEAAIAQELGEEPFAAIDPAPRNFWIRAGKCKPEKQ